MKFTNGYWMLRDEMTPAYAVEYGSHMVKGDELTVYLPGKHIAGRGDALNIPMLTITLSTPLEGVIKVSAVHHAGALYKGPFAEIKNEHPRAEITETEECLTFASGSLRAVIDKTPNAYKLAFYEGDKFLTESSFRNLAHMHNRETGKNYMVEQLLIDVDGVQPAKLPTKTFRFILPTRDMESWWTMRATWPMRSPVRKWRGSSSQWKESAWIIISSAAKAPWGLWRNIRS